MSLNNSDRNLINRYLSGNLSGTELENFRGQLENDQPFKAEVNFQSLLRSGILFSRQEELKKKILENINYRKTKVPYALKLIVTFFFVTMLGITFWFYVGKESSTQTKVNLLFPFLTKEKEKVPDKKNSKDKLVSENSGKDDTTGRDDGVRNPKEEVAIVKEEEASGNENHDTIQASSEDKDIVIKKDQMLISFSLPVIEKSSEKKSQENTSGNATENVVQKLNPAAGVPEEETISSVIETEFWVSPVNYRGYKMSKNKLILFGIEEPAAVKLFRLNDGLYMKYGNDFFHLNSTFEFLSYQRLKETEVPMEIRQ
jgi:hypothetical protein